MRHLLLPVLLCICAAAQQPLQPQNLEQLRGKILMLRNAYHGGELRYDAQGSLVGGGKPGSWTLDSMVLIKEVSVASDRVVLSGERRWALFTNGRLTAYDKPQGRVKIEIAPPGDEAGMKQALQKIFLGPDEKLQDYIPNLCANLPRSSVPTLPGTGASAPRVLAAPDPGYTAEAAKATFNGTVILSLVVEANGKPSSVCVVRPLGLGLDEEAIKAVEQWRFQPAKRDGKPVPIRINAEVNFRLY